MLTNFAKSRDLGLLVKLIEALGAPGAKSALEPLSTYVELVVRWNQKVDLTAARGAGPQLEVLLADALVMANTPSVAPGTHLVDVGPGAGAPLIPLLLLRPDLTAIAVESKRKRVAFLNTAVGTLDLMNRVTIRLQHLDPSHPRVEDQPFDLAMSRATFPPAQWLPIGAALASQVAVFTASGDLPASSQLEKLSSHSYRLPFSAAPRQITFYGNAVEPTT
jgi:16S rRNA (guanine527-N7)-methyltransferase